MKLAVVIPALDEANGIAAAVQSATTSDVQVVVVDGGSADRTAAVAAAAGARVISSAPGRARQLQAGVRASRGDALVFLHADTRLPPGFAAAIRGALRDPAVVGGAFRLRFDAASPALRLVTWGARLRVALVGIAYGDQAVFVRRSELEAIGGVPQAPIMEDLDLVRAMRRRGRFVQLPMEIVTSARRYAARGVVRTVVRNGAASLAWRFGLDRDRLAAWYRR